LRVNGVKVRAISKFALYQLVSWKMLWFKKVKTMRRVSLAYLNTPFQRQEHDISAEEWANLPIFKLYNLGI
jgi:hypothetical protein